MGKPRNDILDRLAYLGLRITSMALHWFPVDLNLRTARLFGTVWGYFDKRHRARAIANLHRSFPDFTDAQCEDLARKSFQQMFMLGVEVLHTTRLVRIDTWRKYVELADFRETFELLMSRNQGLI